MYEISMKQNRNELLIKKSYEQNLYLLNNFIPFSWLIYLFVFLYKIKHVSISMLKCLSGLFCINTAQENSL